MTLKLPHAYKVQTIKLFYGIWPKYAVFLGGIK